MSRVYVFKTSSFCWLVSFTSTAKLPLSISASASAAMQIMNHQWFLTVLCPNVIRAQKDKGERSKFGKAVLSSRRFFDVLKQSLEVLFPGPLNAGAGT